MQTVWIKIQQKLYAVNFIKMFHEKIPSTKDVLIAIPESWNLFDRVNCFESVKSLFKRIKAIMKAHSRATKNPL